PTVSAQAPPRRRRPALQADSARRATPAPGRGGEPPPKVSRPSSPLPPANRRPGKTRHPGLARSPTPDRRRDRASPHRIEASSRDHVGAEENDSTTPPSLASLLGREQHGRRDHACSAETPPSRLPTAPGKRSDTCS